MILRKNKREDESDSNRNSKRDESSSERDKREGESDSNRNSNRDESDSVTNLSSSVTRAKTRQLTNDTRSQFGKKVDKLLAKTSSLYQKEKKKISDLKPGLFKALLEEYNFENPDVPETELADISLPLEHLLKSHPHVLAISSPQSPSSTSFFINARSIFSIILAVLFSLLTFISCFKHRHLSALDADIQTLLLTNENEL